MEVIDLLAILKQHTYSIQTSKILFAKIPYVTSSSGVKYLEENKDNINLRFNPIKMSLCTNRHYQWNYNIGMVKY